MDPIIFKMIATETKTNSCKIRYTSDPMMIAFSIKTIKEKIIVLIKLQRVVHDSVVVSGGLLG